jgi:DsbC/DsbD-like thiol-disulfide interchange protein
VKDRVGGKTRSASRYYDDAILRNCIAILDLPVQIMPMKLSCLTMLLFATAISGPAAASSSDWFEMEGGRVRLVTAGTPDAEGKLRGILDIELKPGWKTYWRDPGNSGVPPTVEASAASRKIDARFDFPPPQWHDEADFKWAGYDHSVAFPVTFTFDGKSPPETIEASVFLGVCETICVPVPATFAVEPARDPDNAANAAAVAAAFAAIPPEARPDFGVKVVSEPGSHEVVLEAALPGDAQTAELFIAGDDGYAFTAPVRAVKEGKTLFSTNVTLPARTGTGRGTGAGLHYTLVTDKGAVSGLLPYF